MRIIFFDIDDTLMDFNSPHTRWIGGSAEPWRNFCRKMRELDKIQNEKTLFGVCSFKAYADDLAEAVIGSKAPKSCCEKLRACFKCKKVKTKKAPQGLEEFLSEDLIYLTKGKPKRNAMYDAACRYGIDSQDIWLVDDKWQESVSKNGFRQFHATDLSCRSIIYLSEKERLRLEAIRVDEFISLMLSAAANPHCSKPMRLSDPCTLPLQNFKAEKQHFVYTPLDQESFAAAQRELSRFSNEEHSIEMVETPLLSFSGDHKSHYKRMASASDFEDDREKARTQQTELSISLSISSSNLPSSLGSSKSTHLSHLSSSVNSALPSTPSKSFSCTIL